ncbi:kinetochore-associated Ndc80 complex subunit ndc80 [Saxophila tyrrhenica]|uniref:Kinetochore protein NDC80 n=1 Tax=Saxophila tyrrhenica TaxID=1690608 RepID=A0AAV9PAD0_9PEZI|nr:kinetochore-associated Ndc80 complex subunit ndc80 [Saxophila tyrrhenica]
MKRSTSNNNLQQAPHTTNHVRTTSGSRMSLAPGRPSQPVFQRSSSGNNLADMGGFSTVQRPSTANFLGSNMTGRKSYAPVASTPMNPSTAMQDSTARRSSVYSARPSAAFGPTAHQSFFTTAPPPNAAPVDPRRLRNPTVKAQMSQDISEFLAQRNFEMETKHTLRPDSMSNPTKKDFAEMFQFLYHCIDPSYRFRDKIENEVPAVMKQLRYPFERSITKSQISAVGGSNGWPTFLALLHWMMQLAKMMESYSTGAYDDACIEAGYDVSADRITFQFLSDAYKEWLSIEDDDDDDEEAKRRIQPHIDNMAAKFEQANQANLEQMKQLEEESKALQEQIDELAKSAPKLANLDKVTKVLEDDRVKFETYNQGIENKIDKYSNRVQLLQQEIEKCEQELHEAEDERNDIQRKVDEQGLSVQDIDRMNTERERLQKGVDSTAVRLDEAKERMQKKEAETGSRLDDLESIVQKYNSLGYAIDIIPLTAKNAHSYEHELKLTINAGPDFSASQSQHAQQSDRLLASATQGYRANDILHSDLKAAKKALQDLRKEISERRNAAFEEDLKKVEMLQSTEEALEDKAAELEGLTHRVRAANEEFEKSREIIKMQDMGSDAQIERLEKELSKMRSELTESVQFWEQKEMNTELEYEQLTLRSSALREELHTELERMLNEVIQFKIHIQGSLEAYEDFVAQEVEREWGEQEAGSAAGGVDGDDRMEE